MKWFALVGAVVVTAGCDQVFQLSRPPVDAAPPLACDDPDLQLCLLFDDDLSDGQATDGSRQQNHASVMRVLSVDRAGQPAVAITPLSDIHILEDSSLDLQDPVTVEMWFNVEVTPPQDVGSLLLDNDNQYALYVDATNAVHCYARRSGTFVLTIQRFTVRTWHHVACVHDGGATTMYLDGSEVDRTQGSGMFSNGDSGTAIGRNGGNGGPDTGPLTGAVDNVRIWSKALIPAEVQAIAGGA